MLLFENLRHFGLFCAHKLYTALACGLHRFKGDLTVLEKKTAGPQGAVSDKASATEREQHVTPQGWLMR